MKQITKRVCGALMALMMVMTMLPIGVFTASAAGAAVQTTYATGDIITFGSYPQTKVTDNGLIASLNAQTLGDDGTVTYDGSRYIRVYFISTTNSYQAINGYFINTVYWFKYEPIQWRVLSNTGGELFVMAEAILSSGVYDQSGTTTWETSSLRAWLNNDFINTAFNMTEKNEIKTSTIVNEDNPWSGIDGGNNTNDRIFLLSLSEVLKTDYGFGSSYLDNGNARQAQGTDFSMCKGLDVSTDSSYLGNSHWWLRSPGGNQNRAGYVDFDAGVHYACDIDNDHNVDVSTDYIGIRPAFRINQSDLSSSQYYSTGDTITFGSYPQTKVTDNGLIASLNAQTLGADGTVTYGGSRYKRVYFTQYTPYYTPGPTTADFSNQDENGYYINTVYWFKFEPIKWRVLSNTNGELFVLADKILASRAYDQALTNVTWETCTMRSWLNNDFYNTAFNSTEQAQIKTSTVVNANNPLYGTDGGSNTADKLFLLSFSEVMNPAYGFRPSYSADDVVRRAQGTDFAKSSGLLVSDNSFYGTAD